MECSSFFQKFERLINDIRHRYFFDCHFQFSCFHFSQVENTVDEIKQVFAA